MLCLPFPLRPVLPPYLCALMLTISTATSSHHAWVVGALNSAYRGVFNFLKKYQMEKGPMRRHWQKKIDELKEKWGTIDELDTGINGTAHLSVMLGRLRPEEHVQVEF